MSRHLRFFGMLLVLLLVLAPFGASNASAQANGCDTSGSVNGSVTPTSGTVGTVVTFSATGFTPSEGVSFWFTLPNGQVTGTPNPIPGGVNRDGTVGPLPLTITEQMVSLGTGRWAVTFQGATSGHQAIIYFCVLTPAEATASPLATSSPTSTSTATEAPTNTPLPATETATATATGAAETPTLTAVPTAQATAAPTHTAVPTPVRRPTPRPTATPSTGTTGMPGMPTTGTPDSGQPIIPGLLALGLLAAGLTARRWARRTR